MEEVKNVTNNLEPDKSLSENDANSPKNINNPAVVLNQNEASKLGAANHDLDFENE